MKNQIKETTFKRLLIGARFFLRALNHPESGEQFRKVSTSEAYKLNKNGTGQTHNKVEIARSSCVEPFPPRSASDDMQASPGYETARFYS